MDYTPVQGVPAYGKREDERQNGARARALPPVSGPGAPTLYLARPVPTSRNEAPGR